MNPTDFKKFADDLGMKYIGNDFDFSLKKIQHIRNFELGMVSVSSDGDGITLNLYEPGGKNYVVSFSTHCLISSHFYIDLDRENMQDIPSNQILLRARLRVQSALLKLYAEKDAHKKNQVGRNTIYITINFGGTLIWK